MLILNRKVEQGFVINENIRVVILAIKRDRIKIGIEAPREIPILRDEIIERGKDGK